jgi:hypothetical protein
MNHKDRPDMKSLIREMDQLKKKAEALHQDIDASSVVRKRFIQKAETLSLALTGARERLSPVRSGTIDVTLGNPKSIAKFFTFNFIAQPRCGLADVVENRFYGAGVYAIYYEGKSVEAYLRLSGTESPVYVGKADPDEAYAETTEEQGEALYRRLKEHARNIAKTDLDLRDFTCRYVAIQSGMQSAVEHFMIQFYQPIWNKEMKVCFGIGKHGDSARTRANKRSPWDTMHPGRRWAGETKEDQKSLSKVVSDIGRHLDLNPPIPDLDALRERLALG